jgi:hypothetical protein
MDSAPRLWKILFTKFGYLVWVRTENFFFLEIPIAFVGVRTTEIHTNIIREAPC